MEEKVKENYIDREKEITTYLDALYQKRVRLSTTKSLLDSLCVTDSWKYTRKKIKLLVEDYMIEFFWEKLAEQQTEYFKNMK